MSINSFSDNDSIASNLTDNDDLSDDESSVFNTKGVEKNKSDKKLLTNNKSDKSLSNQNDDIYDNDIGEIVDDDVDDIVDDDDDDDDEVYDESSITNLNSNNNSSSNAETSIDNKKNIINYKNNVNFLFEDVDIEKFNTEYKNNVLTNHHNECLSLSKEEVEKLIIVHKNADNIIIDELHKTIPVLTKYEKTKILGLRVVQLNNNAKPYINANENMTNIEIALKEIELKKIPLIIKRPLSNNKFEYWRLKDLEIL